MPPFEPFAGLRYAPRVDLAAATAPPYDVISPEERAALAGGHPANAVHVDLPDEADGPDRYRMAAATLVRLQDEGVLVTDPEPAFYAYRMSYGDEDGEPRVTTGVLGALELTRPDEGQILPHEHTTPKAKSDRLDLLRATAHNLSPIWGLTPSRGLTAVLAAAMSRPAAGSCTDPEGVLHELWVVTDPDTITSVRALVGANPLIVADGHHRYETSLAYRDERRAGAGGTGGRYDATLALVVELVDDQLGVRAIHRLVSGLPRDLDLPDALRSRFELTEAPGDASLGRLLVGAASLGLVLPGGRGYLLRPRPGAFDPALPDLDSCRAAAALADLPAHDVLYQHGVDNIVHAVATGRAEAGLLLRPATVAQIAATASGGVRMPPKTTFFWPKPRTGFVYRSLG